MPQSTISITILKRTTNVTCVQIRNRVFLEIPFFLLTNFVFLLMTTLRLLPAFRLAGAIDLPILWGNFLTLWEIVLALVMAIFLLLTGTFFTIRAFTFGECFTFPDFRHIKLFCYLQKEKKKH